MALSQRIARIEDRLVKTRHDAHLINWDEHLSLLSDADLGRLETLFEQWVRQDEKDGYLHEILDCPAFSADVRQELVAIFLSMNFDLLAMRAEAGR